MLLPEHQLRFKLDMDPPTLTFQDKEIGGTFIDKKTGKPRPSIRSSPALKGAIAHYNTLLLINPVRPKAPVSGDLWVRIVFCWASDKHRNPQRVTLRPLKPDADNAFKTLADALAKAGYIADDAQIVHPDPWKLSGPRGWIHVTIGQAAIEQIADVLDEIYPQPKESV